MDFGVVYSGIKIKLNYCRQYALTRYNNIHSTIYEGRNFLSMWSLFITSAFHLPNSKNLSLTEHLIVD